MKKHFRIITMIALVITVLAACKKDEVIEDLCCVTFGKYENGYFVTNEGNFGTGNGSISFVNDDGLVENDVFSSVNSFALGDVVQSMNVIDGNAYIISNGSSKIEVASVDSMFSVATIVGGSFQSPRYILKTGDNKAYVSDWGGGFGGFIVVIDLDSNIQTGMIYNGASPEGMVKVGNKVFTADGGFGWSGSSSKVSVINTLTDAIESTIDVGDIPRSIQTDANGNVWVLCEGLLIMIQLGHLLKVILQGD